jgi:hypothetical protein
MNINQNLLNDSCDDVKTYVILPRQNEIFLSTFQQDKSSQSRIYIQRG